MNLPDAAKHLGQAWDDLNKAVEEAEAAVADLEDDSHIKAAVGSLGQAATALGGAVGNIRAAIRDL